MEEYTYTPSLLLALDSQIIPYSILQLILHVYIPPGGQPAKDPLLSPAHASDEVNTYNFEVSKTI